jgi:hypothetical protein
VRSGCPVPRPVSSELIRPLCFPCSVLVGTYTRRCLVPHTHPRPLNSSILLRSPRSDPPPPLIVATPFLIHSPSILPRSHVSTWLPTLGPAKAPTAPASNLVHRRRSVVKPTARMRAATKAVVVMRARAAPTRRHASPAPRSDVRPGATAPVIPGTHCLRRATVIATDPCLAYDPNRGGAQVDPSRQRVARPGRHRDYPGAAAVAIVVVSSGTSYRSGGHRSSANVVLGI